MRKFLLAILISTTFTVFSQSEKTGTIGRQIITSEMLHKAGILNICDIFLLAKNTYTSTIEGNNLYITQGYLFPFQQQENIILVDGIRCDINVFRNQNTHVLPFTIEQIEFIEFINTPQIVEGEFNSGGIIHIHTKKPPEDLTIRLGYNIGNEIGDPGPYAYIKEKSVNIDKLPMNFNLNLNYQGSKGYFIGTIKSMEGFATDNSIRKRILQITNDEKKFNLLAASFKLRYTELGEYIDFFFGYSENQNYFFLTPYGNELPLKHSYRQYGLNGLFTLDENISVKYLFIKNDNQTADWNNYLPQNFNWKLEKSTARVSSSYISKIFALNFGLEYSELKGNTDQKLDKNVFAYKKFYSDFTFNTTKQLSQSAGIELKDYGQNSTVKIYNNNEWQLSASKILSAGFSVDEGILENSNSFWKWYEYGYSFFDKTVSAIGEIPNELGNKFTADINYYSRLNNKLNYSINALYRYFFNYSIFDQQFYFNDQTNLFKSPTTFYNSEFLKNVNINLEINYITSEYIDQKLFLSFQKEIEASNKFSEHWEIFPLYNAVYEIDYHPHPTFSVWCQINYQSESIWNNYNLIKEQSDNFYSNRIEEKFLINLSFQKWFWQKRIWFNISFRNLLNEAERYYPAGSVFNMRFFTQVKVYLNSVLD